MVLILLLFRRLAGDRLPKWSFVLLGDLTLLRLLCPLDLSTVFSVYRLLRPKGSVTAFLAPNVTELEPTAPMTVIHGGAAGGQVLSEPSHGITFSALLPWLWLAGVVVLGAAFAVTYLRCYRRFALSLPAEDPDTLAWKQANPLRRSYSIRISQEITSPLTYGVLRPVILLPKELDRDALDLVLTHEWTHIRRWDTLRKLVMALTLTVHWFNPLVWVLYGQMNRDIELACDQGVLSRMEEDSRKSYALALLNLEERQAGVMPLYNGFSRSGIEERVRSIMKNRRPTLLISAVALMLVVTLAACFGTTGKNPTHPDDQLPTRSHGEEMRYTAMDFVTEVYTTDYNGRFTALQEARDNPAADMEAAAAVYMSGLAQRTTPELLEKLTADRIPYKYDGLNAEEHPWTVAGISVSGDDETGEYEFTATVKTSNLSDSTSITGQISIDPETLLVTRFWEGAISEDTAAFEENIEETQPLLVSCEKETTLGSSTTMEETDASVCALRLAVEEAHPHFRVAAWVPTGETHDMLWTLYNEKGDPIAGGNFKETMDYAGEIGEKDIREGIYTFRVESADGDVVSVVLKGAIHKNSIPDTDDRAEYEKAQQEIQSAR